MHNSSLGEACVVPLLSLNMPQHGLNVGSTWAQHVLNIGSTCLNMGSTWAQGGLNMFGVQIFMFALLAIVNGHVNTLPLHLLFRFLKWLLKGSSSPWWTS